MKDILERITAMRPHLSLCKIEKQLDEPCGFHLSRSQWDPYPWISNIEDASPASHAGLSIGDFVIEVNGEDILGEKIEQVAKKVKLKNDEVRLLVWKATATEATETEAKFPAVLHFQKFSNFLQSAVQLTECPVCLDNASTPTFQCVNGHILCIRCVVKTSKCPMCRASLSGKGRCLVAEKLQDLINSLLTTKLEAYHIESTCIIRSRESKSHQLSDNLQTTLAQQGKEIKGSS